MSWWYAVVFVVGLVASYALAPKPENTTPEAATEIDAPIAEEGVEIPVLFGTRVLSGPNVVWYGDLKTVAIRKKGGKK